MFKSLLLAAHFLGTPAGVVAYSKLTRSLRCTKLLG